MKKERAEELGQTEYVIQLLADFRWQEIQGRYGPTDYRKIQLLSVLGKEIEIEHSKLLYKEQCEMNDRWIERWNVPSSKGNKTYVVARDRNGNFGCTCPAYLNEKGTKTECKHILLVQRNLLMGQKPEVPLQRKPFTYQDRGRSVAQEEPKHANLTRAIRFED